MDRVVEKIVEVPVDRIIEKFVEVIWPCEAVRWPSGYLGCALDMRLPMESCSKTRPASAENEPQLDLWLDLLVLGFCSLLCACW